MYKVNRDLQRDYKLDRDMNDAEKFGAAIFGMLTDDELDFDTPTTKWGDSSGRDVNIACFDVILGESECSVTVSCRFNKGMDTNSGYKARLTDTTTGSLMCEIKCRKVHGWFTEVVGGSIPVGQPARKEVKP